MNSIKFKYQINNNNNRRRPRAGEAKGGGQKTIDKEAFDKKQSTNYGFWKQLKTNINRFRFHVNLDSLSFCDCIFYQFSCNLFIIQNFKFAHQVKKEKNFFGNTIQTKIPAGRAR